jgi:hypothetical protein
VCQIMPDAQLLAAVERGLCSIDVVSAAGQ